MSERQVKLTARILALNCRVADVKSFFSRRNFPEREIGPKWEGWDKGFTAKLGVRSKKMFELIRNVMGLRRDHHVIEERAELRLKGKTP